MNTVNELPGQNWLHRSTCELWNRTKLPVPESISASSVPRQLRPSAPKGSADNTAPARGCDRELEESPTTCIREKEELSYKLKFPSDANRRRSGLASGRFPEGFVTERQHLSTIIQKLAEAVSERLPASSI